MAENMFDGFDHTQYKDEVEQRWGTKAYADSDRWWRSMSADEKAVWQRQVSDLGRDWIAAAESGIAPESDEAQAIAKRHVEWLTGIPGTPAASTGSATGANGDVKGYVIGLGEMYVADPRFTAHYDAIERESRANGARAGFAAWVRDAWAARADRG